MRVALRFTAALVVAFACAVVSSSRLAEAQGLPLSLPIATPSPAPYGIGAKRVRGIDTAPIRFEGQTLFTIAAPLPSANDAVPPIMQRVDAVEDNLQRIVPTAGGFMQLPVERFDPETFRVEIGNSNGYPTLYATDGHHAEAAQILTVTEADATLYGTTNASLAQQWQAQLQSVLQPAVQAFAPGYFTAQLKKLPFVLAGASLATWLVWLLLGRLQRRTAVRGLLTWILIALWLLVAQWSFAIFPATRGYATSLARQVVLTALLWLAIAALNAILSIVIQRSADHWQFRFFMTPEERARHARRRPTIAGVIDNLKLVVLCVFGVFFTLSIFSVSSTSEFAIGAVVVFGLSFAAQSVIKDYVIGFLILAEDQFAVGDTVTINGTNGVVESLTLRISQIRTDAGTLVTIANSAISTVENFTRGWSRVDFRIAISLDADVERALGVMRETLLGMAAEEPWRSAILETPEILGVDALGKEGILLRAWVKIKASQRNAAAREANRRVEEAFRASGIALAVPQAFLITPAQLG